MALWRRHRRAHLVVAAAGATVAAALMIVAALAALGGDVTVAASSHAERPPHRPASGRDRSLKMDLVDRLPESPQAVILGGSRCTRFEPAYLTRLTGLSAVNLALTNFRPEDAWAVLNRLYVRDPGTRVRVFWGITANTLTDIPLAPGLVYDERLSQAFPAELLAEQDESRAAEPPAVSPLRSRFSDRGFLAWNVYDARRAHGLSLDDSLDGWIARYVTDRRWAPRPSPRAKEYFERTLALLRERGVKPCIVLMPYHPRALAALERTAWHLRQDECRAYLSGLQLEYGFTLLDYTGISAFGGDPDGFYDGAHVTVENARLLMANAVREAPWCFE